MLGLETVVQQLEKIRKRVISIHAIAGVLGIIGVITLTKSTSGILILFVALCVSSYGSKKSSEYCKKAKQSIILELMQRSYEDVSFDPISGFTSSFIMRTEMIKLGNTFSSNDLFAGKYKEVQFEQADLLVQDRKVSGRKVKTTTLFKGQYRIFEFKKNFTSYMQIRVKEGILFKKSKKPYQFFTLREKTKRLELENKEFNEIFDVYASDAHEAFYILTPNFMEKMMKLNEHLYGSIVVGFMDNVMHIATNTEFDLFEISAWKPINEEYIEKAEKEVGVIKQIIDILNLE